MRVFHSTQTYAQSYRIFLSAAANPQEDWEEETRCSAEDAARCAGNEGNQTIPKDDAPPPPESSVRPTCAPATDGAAPLRPRVQVAESVHRLPSGGQRGLPRELPLGLVPLFASRQAGDADAPRHAPHPSTEGPQQNVAI